MADVIIRPGQSKNLAFDFRTQFNEALELLHVIRPNVLDWRNGAPAITFTNETRAHEYDDTREAGPVLDEVELQEIGANRKIYEHGIKVKLTQLDTYTEETKLAIAENFKRDFLNDANYWATYTFLRDTVGKIDFEGEYAENNVEWDFLDPNDHDNIRGLSYEQVRNAQSQLVAKRKTTGDLVMIAPSSLQETLEKSNPFLYSQGGFPGMRFDNQALARTRGILTWWVPDVFFTDLGLCTDDIDGAHAKHRGFYAYVLRGADTYFVTSIGSEVVLNGMPWLKDIPDYHDSGMHVLVGRYAIGATMKNIQNCIRIKCRLN